MTGSVLLKLFNFAIKIYFPKSILVRELEGTVSHPSSALARAGNPTPAGLGRWVGGGIKGLGEQRSGVEGAEALDSQMVRLNIFENFV